MLQRKLLIIICNVIKVCVDERQNYLSQIFSGFDLLEEKKIDMKTWIHKF